MVDATPLAASSNAPRGEPEWALFLDFDGTLVDIVERPDAVVVEPELRPNLGRLSACLDGALAIVTGRSINVVDRFLAPLRLDVAGLHGVEYRLGGLSAPCTPEAHPDLRQALVVVAARIPDEPGVLIEDKGCSFAVHWRLAPEAEEEVLALVEDVAAGLGPDYRLQKGKSVAEVLPASAGKGPIIEHFLQTSPYRGRRPIFIGDDLTDEHGFAAVNALGGVSIRIGREPTQAQRRIETAAGCRHVLARWAAAGRIDPSLAPTA